MKKSNFVLKIKRYENGFFGVNHGGSIVGGIYCEKAINKTMNWLGH